MKKVSIIIVTYNAEKYIYDCISSIRESTIDIHIIVIDNGSQDKTLDIIRTSEIKFLPQPSGNPKIKFSIFSASALRKQPKEFYVGKPHSILPNNVILTKI